MRIFLLYILLLTACLPSIAGTGYMSAGAAPAGMGGAALGRQDVWALYYNPAGIAFMKESAVGLSYEKRYSLKELSTNGLAVALPLGKSGMIGVNAVYYGFKNYNEQLAGLTYARRFGDKISAAVKFNYQSFNIGEEYGSKTVFTGEVGMQAKIVRNLWIGAHLYNPAQTKLTETPSENIPSLFSLGASYIFSDKFRIEALTEKSSDEKALFKTGFEYHPIKQFWLRAGITSKPLMSSFGFGLDLDNFKVDFAAGFHQQLGFTPTLSLGYTFAKKS